MKFHNVDYLSLIFGAFFVVIAGMFLSNGFDAFDLDIRWIGPAALVVIGLAFLLPSRRRPTRSTEPATSASVSTNDPLVDAAKDELFPSPLD